MADGVRHLKNSLRRLARRPHTHTYESCYLAGLASVGGFPQSRWTPFLTKRIVCRCSKRWPMFARFLNEKVPSILRDLKVL